MEDKTLKCKDCGAEFVFTAGEQAFYKEKGFENEPQRCPECRRARKQARNNARASRF
ncbi:MAG: cytochrome C551 [Clostridiaceae bacterium]|nr:cytochrome C551 [Clostridiaceae bacterium]